MAVQRLETALQTCSVESVPEITTDELGLAARRMWGTAPGLDGIRAEMLQGLVLQWVSAVSNRALLGGDVPVKWSEIDRQ